MGPSTARQQSTAPPAAAQPRRRPSPLLLMVAIPLIPLSVLSPPVILVAIFGLLPAVVAWTVDRSDERAAAFSVGGLNLGGVFPYLLPVWSASDGIAAAIDILTDAVALAVMYGAAACGWLLLVTLPPAIATVQKTLAERRSAELKAEQQRLVEQWGEAVTGGASPGEGT